MIKAPGILRMPQLSNRWTESLQIKFVRTVLVCKCATPWSFAHGGIMGMSMGVIKASGILRTLELRNHWADSFQIKSCGTALVCRCATAWHLVHRAGDPPVICLFISGDCHWTSLMISQHWFRWWLGATRQQPVI